MIETKLARVLPYSQQQLFELAADIECYPSFVPGFRRAQVLGREGDLWQVRQSVGFGPALVGFDSQAHLEPPCCITVRSRDAPFGEMAIRWRFEPLGSRCRTHLTARLEPAANPLGRTVARLWCLLAPKILEAFVQRAAQQLS